MILMNYHLNIYLI